MLYNFHRVPRTTDVVVIVECPWGVMRLHQLGVPAIALLGTRLFPEPLRLLAHIPRVGLLLDGDDAGRMAADRLRRQLPRQAHEICLPDGADPDEIGDQALFDLLLPLFLS